MCRIAVNRSAKEIPHDLGQARGVVRHRAHDASRSIFLEEQWAYSSTAHLKLDRLKNYGERKMTSATLTMTSGASACIGSIPTKSIPLNTTSGVCFLVSVY